MENLEPAEISGLLCEAVIDTWAVDPCVPAVGLVPLPSRSMMVGCRVALRVELFEESRRDPAFRLNDERARERGPDDHRKRAEDRDVMVDVGLDRRVIGVGPQPLLGDGVQDPKSLDRC